MGIFQKNDTIYNELNRITEIENDKDVYLVISTNGKYGLTKKGKVILEPEFTEISFDKNSNLIIVTKGNATGIVDLKGKSILPIDYDFVTIGGDYIIANKGETKLVFNTLGEQIDTDVSNHTTVSKEYSIIIDNDNYYNMSDSSSDAHVTINSRKHELKLRSNSIITIKLPLSENENDRNTPVGFHITSRSYNEHNFNGFIPLNETFSLYPGEERKITEVKDSNGNSIKLPAGIYTI